MAFCQNEADIVRSVSTDDCVCLYDFSPVFIRRMAGPAVEDGTYTEAPEYNVYHEYVLPSGKRIDLLLVDKCGRSWWVIEFKQHASISAVVQVLSYSEELVRRPIKGKKRISKVFPTIIASSFDEDAMFLARRFRIPLLHFREITQVRFLLTPLFELERRRRGYIPVTHQFHAIETWVKDV